MILPVEIGKLHLFGWHSALLADHVRQGAFKSFYEVRAFAHFTCAALAGSGDGMKHKTRKTGHVKGLATEGDHTGNRSSYPVHVNVYIGGTVLQGIENGNTGKHLSAVGIDVYVDIGEFAGQIRHLRHDALSIHAFVTADLSVQHDGDTAGSGRHDIEKFTFRHRRLGLVIKLWRKYALYRNIKQFSKLSHIVFRYVLFSIMICENY